MFFDDDDDDDENAVNISRYTTLQYSSRVDTMDWLI